MLMPKKTKYRKSHKGRRLTKGVANRGHVLSFGDYGLKSLEQNWITSRQIESARKTISRHIKKQGKLWIRIFPSKPITKKGAEVPMGGGKGAVEYYVVPIKPGTIIFEITGLDEELSKKVLKSASHKLPVKTRIVSKI